MSKFGIALNRETIYIAGGGTYMTDKDNEKIWTCTDEIKSVSVMDIINNKPDKWNIHAKLPQPGLVNAFGEQHL